MENYMFASYLNLQGIARDLFTYILKELHWVIDKFGKLHFNSEYHQFLKPKSATRQPTIGNTSFRTTRALSTPPSLPKKTQKEKTWHSRQYNCPTTTRPKQVYTFWYDVQEIQSHEKLHPLLLRLVM